MIRSIYFGQIIFSTPDDFYRIKNGLFNCKKWNIGKFILKNYLFLLNKSDI